MNNIPDIEFKEPLTLRQHEQYVHDNHPRKEGETDEEFQKRLDERLDRLRVDFERKSKRGTLYLMDAPTHLERATEVEGFANEESDPKKRMCLFQAAQIHRRHAERLDAEAAEKEGECGIIND